MICLLLCAESISLSQDMRKRDMETKPLVSLGKGYKPNWFATTPAVVLSKLVRTAAPSQRLFI